MQKIQVDDIQRSENQPRESFVGIAELAESIKEQGLLEPLIIRPNGKKYELVAGERRLRACKQAGLQEVDCIVRELSDKDAYQLSVMENMQRENLTPLEQARAFEQLQAQGMKQGEIGKLVGLSQSQVATKLRILALPDGALQAWNQGQLSDGHVKQLLRLETPEEQSEFAADVMSRDIRVKQLKKDVDARLEHLERKRELEKRKQAEPELIPSDDDLLAANGVENPWASVWYAEYFSNAPSRLHGVLCLLIYWLENALSKDKHDSIKKVSFANFEGRHNVDLEMAIEAMHRKLSSVAEADLIFLDIDDEKKDSAFEVIKEAKENQIIFVRCGPDEPTLNSKYILGLASILHKISSLKKDIYRGQGVTTVIRKQDEDGNFCTPDELEKLQREPDYGFGLIQVTELLEPLFMSRDIAEQWQAQFALPEYATAG